MSALRPRERHDLPFHLKRSAKKHPNSLSLLKVESTLCFQRKRSTLTSCALNPRA
ncbi:hypothetical protein HMPREF1584_00933 [Gardnerella vaginalis JCP8481A]|uniref:Uncharacterized protein n=1 Tax=Gardnerella vaginalis TaxID=2702 RepID=A0A133NSI5_GARVA|nr:hypothetical protein HMPREF1584_00933 [Gardnerella vaginalis JCP8481A]KXA19255.1 hypothetical protein HMPREF3208_01139 [Gardnerella vaginalis]